MLLFESKRAFNSALILLMGATSHKGGKDGGRGKGRVEDGQRNGR